jgi:tripartite-type tricarboxylate transporter receptor subunit TctC
MRASFLLSRRALGAVLAIGVLGVAGAVHAQAWPTKAVTIVVPFAPGGGTDIGTRIVAQKLSQLWGQPVVVDNRGGAGGNLGLDIVARAKPDGYTLVTGNVGTQSINPTLYKKLSYNPDTSFAPIGLFAELPFVLAVTNSLPVKNVQELVALAKAQPDKLTYASSGSGGSPHLSAETFKLATGTKILHVPYKGGGAAMADLIAGNVHMLFASVLELSGHIKAGKLKALAVTSAQRSPALPDVPTLAEAGISGAESGSWVALMAPAGTPKEVVDRIVADVKEVVADPQVRSQLVSQGATPQSSTPAQLQALIDSDKARYGKVIRDKGVKVE